MEKTKHTPGPWTIRDNQDVMADEEGRLIAQCHAGYREERGANARLIAAAPDLLAACQRAIDHLVNIRGPLGSQDGGRLLSSISLLGIAMSRATGKEWEEGETW